MVLKTPSFYRVDEIKTLLSKFLDIVTDEDLSCSLIIAEEHRYRIKKSLNDRKSS